MAQRANCMHWICVILCSRLDYSRNFGVWGDPRTNPPWIWRDNYVFKELKAICRFSAVQGIGTQPPLFKGQA